MENQNQNEDQRIQAPTPEQGKKSSVWKIVVGVLVVGGLAAAAYFLGAGDLFKGQIKLSAEEQCKKAFETYTKDHKKTGAFKRCEKKYPDMLKSLQGAGNAQVVVGEPKGFVFDSFKIAKVENDDLQSDDDAAPFFSFNLSDGVFTLAKKDYVDEVVTVKFDFPTYTDQDMPPMIARPFQVEICSFNDDSCSTISKVSLNVYSGKQVNSGVITFSSADLFTAVQNIGGKEKFGIVEKEDNGGFLSFYKAYLNLSMMDLDGKFVKVKAPYYTFHFSVDKVVWQSVEAGPEPEETSATQFEGTDNNPPGSNMSDGGSGGIPGQYQP